jgi:quercetin dioxygenase-like cupin family protein
MEQKLEPPSLQDPESDHTTDKTLFRIDLTLYIQKLKMELSYKTKKKNVITVFKTRGLRIVVIALEEGAEMTRHAAEAIITVHVLEGELKFTTDGESVPLSTGQMLTLRQRIPHSIIAIKETIFLLTLTTTMAVKIN